MSQVLENIDYYKILQAILIIGGATWVARYSTNRISRFAKRYTRHRHWLMNTSAILRFILFIGATVLAATTLFNFTKEALIASAGAIALTFSLAFQDLASSFVGGITLLVDRPFEVGDRVSFKKHYGEIVEIGLRAVRLRTLDDTIISIPNNQFLKEAVGSANGGDLDMMVVMNFYLNPNSDFELAKQIVYEAVVTSQYAYLAKEVTILVEDKIVDVVFATHITAKAYVFNTRFEKLFASDVTERVKSAFKKHDIRSATTDMPTSSLPMQRSA
ncbi:MAG TPA: mechanosensitive ion channel [Myxococcales bacterium]|nr:mechanosensitive ion channel [Myxococcales bacterium]